MPHNRNLDFLNDQTLSNEYIDLDSAEKNSVSVHNKKNQYYQQDNLTRFRDPNNKAISEKPKNKRIFNQSSSVSVP